MAYLLDSNVFIEAKNMYYGFDFCPAFWEWLGVQNKAKRVFSIEKVYDELLARADEVSEWAEASGAGFFVAPDEALIPALGTVAEWATSHGNTPAAVNEFLQAADYYLVASALAGGHTVVTRETAQPKKSKIKIPIVCIGLGIKVINPFEMLRAERARFVLAS